MRLTRPIAVVVASAALFAGCGSSTGTATKPASGDFADASSGGDRATAAAIRKDASFKCPDAAAQAGKAGAPLPPD
ncbi:MAG: hypothetical protein M3011_01255, partial [Actinomycetota bacterium]|nr:hypothetical protein [Actinomycetota bacterium]